VSLLDKVEASEVIDSGINLSDHLPLVLHLSDCLPVKNSDCDRQSVYNNKHKRLRWDKADLISYYNATNVYLGDISYPSMCTSCANGCSCEGGDGIDAFYEKIVEALCRAADEHCPATTASYYKHYWDDELTELKHKSIAAHDMWKAVGRPSHGPIYEAKRCAKAEYKLAIRNKQATEHKHISNDLHDYLLSKDTTAFWKTWESKFKSKRKTSVTVDGFTEPNKIANAFATNFKNACSPNNETHNQDLKNKFLARFSQYHPACKFSTVSVEGVDQCIRKMKRGKAPGLDRIEAEHLVHAHPRLCVLLSLLFNQMLMHGNVPAKFGLGVIIPVEKGAALDNCKSDNYRGITLSSNLSKLLKCVCNNCMVPTC